MALMQHGSRIDGMNDPAPSREGLREIDRTLNDLPGVTVMNTSYSDGILYATTESSVENMMTVNAIISAMDWWAHATMNYQTGTAFIES